MSIETIRRKAASTAILMAAALPLIACPEETAAIKVGPNGISIGSQDNANVVRLRGTLHFDGRRFPDGATPDSEDRFVLRRVRPTLEASLNGICDFHLTPDFGDGGTTIVDAFIAARVKPWLRFTAGKFKVPVGLERLESSNDLRFIERGFPTSLVPNRAPARFDSGRTCHQCGSTCVPRRSRNSVSWTDCGRLASPVANR